MSTETPHQLESDSQETDALDDLRNKIADKALASLDSKKDWVIGLASTAGISLNPAQQKAKEYILSQDKKKGIFDRLTDNIKHALITKVSKDANLNLEYDPKKLEAIKEALKKANTQEKLEALEKQIDLWKDPIELTSSPVPTTELPVAAVAPLSTTSSVEHSNESGKRGEVLTKLNEVVAYDKTHPIKYSWWGRNNVQSWLDCSWLLIYTMHQAGLQSPGWDSRDIFQHVSTEKVPVVSDWTSSTLSSIKPGDAIFWNATNEKYNWKTWKIPTIKKGDVDYRIHHICFVKEVSSDGKITIVESSGSQWVVERQIDPNHELTATKHKSELYVGHIDYDGLLAYNAKPDEQLLAAA